MGIINKLFGNKEKSNNKDISSEIKIQDTISTAKVIKEDLIVKKINYDSPADRAKYITNNCEQILESVKQLDELKVEYQAVTSYLTDIQKIDRIPKEEREELNDVARKVISFTSERSKYQTKTTSISDSQFKYIARYEEEMPEQLAKMKEYEVYQSIIKNDIQHLEGEKGSITYEIEEIEEKHDYLNKMAVTTCFLVIILFSIFFILGYAYKANMQIPFFMTIILAIISVIYIFINATQNKKDMKLAERKLNKAITLLNKVKIKYINNTNALDYVYQKFMVNSYTELSYLWSQYIKAKEEEKLFLKNSQQLERYNRELIAELKTFDIVDPDVWIYQAAAIIDDKEMVEVRHSLNVRRQKLRELIDNQNKTKDVSISEIQKLLEERPDCRNEITSMISKLGIILD